MKKTIGLFLAVAMLASVPLMAQEGPPPALASEFLDWMAGEWTGKSTSPMGETTDWMSCEIGMGNQFLLINFKADMGAISMEGMGAITTDKDGFYKGFWIDSWRSMSSGKGTLEGTKLVMTWTGADGEYTRTTERVGDDKLAVSFKMVGPDGSEMTGSGEYTRKKK